MKKSVRNLSIRIRVNEEEKETISKKANGDISSWLRDLALDSPTRKKRKAKPVNPQLLFELNKIGVNLNQIAKAINSKPDLVEQLDLHLILISIDTSLKKIREVYS
jgi:hypothetical protein